MFLLYFFFILAYSQTGFSELVSPANQAVEKLILQKQWQEALWLADDLDDDETVEYLEKILRETIDSQGFNHMKIKANNSGGYSSSSFLMNFGEGIQTIVKPNQWDLYNPVSWIYGNNWVSNTSAEVAPYRLDRYFHFNLVPFTMKRSWFGLSYSFQYMIKESLDGRSYFRKKHNKVVCDGYWILKPKNGITKLVSDYIFDNIDNHCANWLYWENENRIITVDNGLSCGSKSSHHYRLFGAWEQVFNKKTCQFRKLEKLDLKDLPEKVKQNIIHYDKSQILGILKDLSGIDSNNIIARIENIRTCLIYPPSVGLNVKARSTKPLPADFLRVVFGADSDDY
jgi:hypothetical protein